MTQVGDGPYAAEPSAGSSTPNDAELLAERYQLEQHINNDSAGRQVWRGIDVVLLRPVAMVLCQPGGPAAAGMLSAAVAASRVGHPNLVGVYDAIDEGSRAYVVREWIDGMALRDAVRAEQNQRQHSLDPEQTTSVLHGVAAAVAALHANGIMHGNVHPGTVLIANDGRVVLVDARGSGGDAPATVSSGFEQDIRALGALGYFMLTGQWPYSNTAYRDNTGALAAPHQVRAGIPAYLDNLVMDLLNPELAPPTAHVLAAELARLDTAEQLLLGGQGTLRFADNQPERGKSATPKLVAVGSAAVALVAVGLVLGVKAISANNPPANPSPSVAGTPLKPDANPTPLALTPAQIRIVDPGGDRTELDGVAHIVDGSLDTVWRTDRYNQAEFGLAKPGMGILIKLDRPYLVSGVKITLTHAGATAQLRAGGSDPGDTTEGDLEIHDTYTAVGDPVINHPGTVMVLSTDLSEPYQYLLIWFTELPRVSGDEEKYQIGVQDLTVEVL